MIDAGQPQVEILPDVLREALDLVFCGTAPSKKSASAGAYYANRNNRFWNVLYECRFTETKLEPSQFWHLQSKNIGLTDLCKFASGSDDKLLPSDFLTGRLTEAIQRFQPRFLAFTSKNAGQIYLRRTTELGEQPTIGNTRIFVLPTTSPRRGIKWWSEKKIYWHKFAHEFHSSNRSGRHST